MVGLGKILQRLDRHRNDVGHSHAVEIRSIGFNPTTADKNAAGLDAYRQCCYKAGIRS